MAEEIYVIFDGPPGHDAPRFIEVEDERGQGIGESEVNWREDHDGHTVRMSRSRPGETAPMYWRLGPFYLDDGEADLQAAEAKIERLLAAGEAMRECVISCGGEDCHHVQGWEEAKNS